MTWKNEPLGQYPPIQSSVLVSCHCRRPFRCSPRQGRSRSFECRSISLVWQLNGCSQPVHVYSERRTEILDPPKFATYIIFPHAYQLASPFWKIRVLLGIAGARSDAVISGLLGIVLVSRMRGSAHAKEGLQESMRDVLALSDGDHTHHP